MHRGTMHAVRVMQTSAGCLVPKKKNEKNVDCKAEKDVEGREVATKISTRIFSLHGNNVTRARHEIAANEIIGCKTTAGTFGVQRRF